MSVLLETWQVLLIQCNKLMRSFFKADIWEKAKCLHWHKTSCVRVHFSLALRSELWKRAHYISHQLAVARALKSPASYDSPWHCGHATPPQQPGASRAEPHRPYSATLLYNHWTKQTCERAKIFLFYYLFICSNMIEHKTILLKQLHEQDNKALINNADSCPN